MTHRKTAVSPMSPVHVLPSYKKFGQNGVVAPRKSKVKRPEVKRSEERSVFSVDLSTRHEPRGHITDRL